MFFRSHDASIPENKMFNAYENVWIKCEVVPNDPHTFPETREKREKI